MTPKARPKRRHFGGCPIFMAKHAGRDSSIPAHGMQGGTKHNSDSAVGKGMYHASDGEAYCAYDSGSHEGRLIEACLQGDEWAWRKLIELFHGRVYGMVYRMLGNHDDAADVTQEVFIKVFEGLKRFRKGSTLGTWIYRISVNVCLEHLRRRRETPMSSLTEEERSEAFAVQDPSPSPEEVAERGDLKELVWTAIHRLPTNMRLVIVLCDLEGLSYEEAANVLGVPIGTVKSRLNRARLALKDELSKMMRQKM